MESDSRSQCRSLTLPKTLIYESLIVRPLHFKIVLVRSIYERNIGATSRAMANMGIKDLILIDPKCELTLESQKAAATGQFALQNKMVYASWDDFFENEPRGLMIATTARDGRGRQAQDLSETLTHFLKTSPELQKQSDDDFTVHVVFGPEDWGLSAEDIKWAHYCCSIPIYGDNTSLNLAQATLLAMYIIRTVCGGEKARLEGQQKPKSLQKKQENIFPDITLKTWLQAMGFNLSKKKINVYTVLRRMLLQNAPSTKEFRTLEIVLQQSIRKLNELNQLKKEKSNPKQLN